jgi:predicted O-methyltransferase YrrM
MSVLLGLVMGSGIRRIVQLGHYAGFSTLLFGFMLRHMGAPHGLISYDIDPGITDYTADFVKRAGLEDYVRLVVRDSAASENLAEASAYLGGDPQLIFIDSSHQYEHTLRELDLWYPHLKPGGIIAMHDVSEFAHTFDGTGAGGVFRAVAEWLLSNPVPALMLNRGNWGIPFEELCYTDGCGLGLIQKLLPRRPEPVH